MNSIIRTEDQKMQLGGTTMKLLRYKEATELTVGETLKCIKLTPPNCKGQT